MLAQERLDLQIVEGSVMHSEDECMTRFVAPVLALQELGTSLCLVSGWCQCGRVWGCKDVAKG